MHIASQTPDPVEPLRVNRIIHTWWPLAASWLLMAAESPALSAVVARLPNPEINLAAYGGITFPIALIIESPIIMLLAASTALSRDWASYQKLYRYMMIAGAILTGLHLLFAFTPLYYFLVVNVMGAPQEIIEPARIGMMIMTPWTWSIAYRRFHQGVLIRFDHSKAVGVGTLVRLIADFSVLGIGYLIGTIPGIVVATSAIAAGVLSEAIYAGWVVRPVLQHELKMAPEVKEAITYRSFLHFYIPLALTSLLGLIVQPIGSAAMSRMPNAVNSLAVWQVVSGLVFMLRSAGMAYNEVVVALLDEPHSSNNLRRFTIFLTAATSIILLVISVTPLSNLWYREVLGLNPDLVSMAILGTLISVPLPGLNVLQSWYQGVILHSRKTRGISEAVVVFLVVSIVLLISGVVWGKTTGLYIGVAVFGIAMLAQTIWLWVRSRPALHLVQNRDLRRPLNSP